VILVKLKELKRLKRILGAEVKPETKEYFPFVGGADEPDEKAANYSMTS